MKTKIIGLFLVLFAYAAFAQETGSIYGTIYDKETGKPIPNADVIIDKNKGSVTGQDGTFEFKNLKPGVYILETHMLGYKPEVRTKIHVVAGEKKLVDFKLVHDNVDLNEIVISASKTEKTIKAIGSPIYVIGKNRIEQTNNRNISEALMEIPGVFIEDSQNTEAAVIGFRGIGLHTYVTRGILVLVDGIPITEAMGRTSFEAIDMQNVEKIEVLKGPVSALYGPNGLSGVINVVEKKPKDGIHGDFEGLLGSYGTGKISANINGGKNDFNYMVRANHYKSDGYRDHSAYESTHLGLKLMKKFKVGGRLNFTVDYSLSDSELAGSIDSLTFADNPTAADRKFAGYDKKLYRVYLDYLNTWDNKSTLTANVYTRGRGDEGHYSDRTWGNYNVDLFGGEARYQLGFDLFNQHNKITFGAKFDRESSDFEEFSRDEDTGVIGDLSNKGEVVYDLFGFYLEDEFNINDKLYLTLGLRYDLIKYDWNDQFNEGTRNTSNTEDVGAFSPKLSFAYNPTTNLTVFGNIGKGFNPPQYSELFIGGRTAAPNPDLRPEYLTNYEIGVRGVLIKKMNYQFSYYLMDFVDQISTAPIPDDPAFEIYENVGDTRHKGVEAMLNYQFTDGFRAYVSYSYLDARFTKDPDDVLVGNRLRNAPYNQYTFGARYNFDFGLAISADYRFVDEYPMDNEEMFTYEGYSVLNAKIFYKLKRFRVALAINNVLDLEYAARAYASNFRGWAQNYSPALPRNFTFTLGYNF